MSNFKNNWTGQKTKSIDGTGVLASVTEEIAARIHKFILDKSPETKKILDIGAGQGLLQKIIEQNSTTLVWSMEGCSAVPFKANKERLLISDATIKFSDEYKKFFNLVTSFECIEHIPLEDQNILWENIFFCSNNALVGIHCENEENDYHCLIRNLQWWKNFFINKGINFELLGSPKNPWPVWPEAQCSLFFWLNKYE